MKLSNRTIGILKNYSSINSHLFVRKGSKISTMAIAKNIVSETTVEEDFPNDFGIFNLPEFLGVLNLMQAPDITFEDKKMVIKDGKNKLTYIYSDPSILTYKQKDLNLPSEDVKFTITAEQIQQLQKACAALSVQDVAFIGDGKTITARVLDKSHDTSNSYDIDLDAKTDTTFTAYFKIDNWKQISDTYDVILCNRNISKFIGKNNGVEYFIAVETDSKFVAKTEV